MKVSVSYETIGNLNYGIDGMDEYVKAKADGPLDQAAFKAEVQELFEYDCVQPGGRFCHIVIVFFHPTRDDEAIIVIKHRFDN